MKTIEQHFELDVPRLMPEKIDRYIFNSFVRKRAGDVSLESGPAVGVEIEVEGIPHPGRLCETSNLATYLDRYWDITVDGSLRNNGQELVSKVLNGVGIVNALYVAEDAITKYKTNKPDFTDRTSVHIHVDMTKKTIEDLYKLFIVYAYVEPVFYELPTAAGLRSRYNNNFCVPLMNTHRILSFREQFMSYFANPTDRQAYNTLNNLLLNKEYKYTGFNFHSLRYHGTIEFRHFQGTAKASLIISWINYIYRMIKFAESRTTEQLIEEITALNSNSAYYVTLTRILGHVPILISKEMLRKLEDGVKWIKFITSHKSYDLKWNGSVDSSLFTILKTTYGIILKKREQKETEPNVLNNVETLLKTIERLEKELDHLLPIISLSTVAAYNSFIIQCRLLYEETGIIYHSDVVPNLAARIQDNLLYDSVEAYIESL